MRKLLRLTVQQLLRGGRVSATRRRCLSEKSEFCVIPAVLPLHLAPSLKSLTLGLSPRFHNSEEGVIE
ncbi:hypothetical protein FRX31_002331 [Thalictrum thalictroides]|uniref:Uncharacterized protein n=1 Tax=Thalictrum thalictroides TaxID=46969 RepID=A0A7J6XH96_THATH|nr:hypothetical protein FRX31_002331 [Thalictrum thalictroides]